MKMTFRWYGKEADPIPLLFIKQIPGMTGIMGTLDYKKAGEFWQKEEIKALVEEVKKAGLELEVIESVNVHEDIKLGLPSREEYIENYIKTIENLASFGLKVIVYNFMPVFDWLRTELKHLDESDGSTSLYFSQKQLDGLTPEKIVENTMKGSSGFSLPGWEKDRLALLKETLKKYEKVDEKKLLENYGYFLKRIIPTCEKCGVRMAVHPDDPAWSIFGLPRIVHNEKQLDDILSLVDSPSNSLCLCTGSLGSEKKNDIPYLIEKYGKKGRIACCHVRNIKFLAEREFKETAHFSKVGSFDMYKIMKAIYMNCPDVYIRPDHGRDIWGENARPGYGFYDRALGSVYLQGLWEAIDKES